MKTLHHTETPYKGRRIIIDAADLTAECGYIEVMAMYPNGEEITSHTTHDPQDAENVYNAFCKRFAERPAAVKPLTGKYAALRDALRQALEAGRAAERANPEDGGACNFDASALYLPRWQSAKVEQAAREAGTRCTTWTLFGTRKYVFSPNTSAQGNARSRNAEAMTAALAALGFDAVDYCQLD